MLLAIITDTKNQTSSHPILADSLDLLNYSLKKLNPENLGDLTVTPILYFDSIQQLQNHFSTPLNIRSGEVTPSPTHQPQGGSLYGFIDPISEQSQKNAYEKQKLEDRFGSKTMSILKKSFGISDD